jgi:hypothetical protein
LYQKQSLAKKRTGRHGCRPDFILTVLIHNCLGMVYFLPPVASLTASAALVAPSLAASLALPAASLPASAALAVEAQVVGVQVVAGRLNLCRFFKI